LAVSRLLQQCHVESALLRIPRSKRIWNVKPDTLAHPVLQALWQVLGLMARHSCLLQQQGQGLGSAATPPSSVRGPAAARGPAADAPGAAVELADVLTVGGRRAVGRVASPRGKHTWLQRRARSCM
jgi:hypothetical protein